MRLLKLFALVATLTATAAGAAQGDPGGWGPETPNFNLEVVLGPALGGPADGFGLVKFRQPNDGDKKVYLDVWVRDLAPGTYSLQRATDTNVDDECTGTNWLTLGAIPVDDRGTGRAALERDLTALPTGAQFDIHFRVIDPTTAVVLESACYQFVVSQ